MIHIAHDTYDRKKPKESWSHFLGQLWSNIQLFHIYVLHKIDSHDTETKVGHIFGADFATDAVLTYGT